MPDWMPMIPMEACGGVEPLTPFCHESYTPYSRQPAPEQGSLTP